MRYYQQEHQSAYREIAESGLQQWNDLMAPEEGWTFDEFQNRGFLNRALHTINMPGTRTPRAFEYGCGTGPAACFLASRGFQVEAMDLIPEAIDIGRTMAADRNLDVRFAVGDICNRGTEGLEQRFDLVIDSYCLQSIVTDEDRGSVFTAVKTLLAPDGHYVVSTALWNPDRRIGGDHFFEADSGTLYRAYQGEEVLDHTIQIENRRYAPHRRHLTPDQLFHELTTHGFEVMPDSEIADGNVICCLA